MKTRLKIEGAQRWRGVSRHTEWEFVVLGLWGAFWVVLIVVVTAFCTS